MTAPRSRPRDEPGAPDDGWSWSEAGAWVLVLSTALPVVLTVETVRRVLSGTLDQFTLGFDGEGGDRGPGYAARWALLQQFSDVQSGLLAAGAGAALLAGVALAGRPGWLVPHGAARWAALATAVVSGLTGLGMLMAVLARWSLGPGEPQYFARTDLFVSLAPVTGVAVFTLGVSTLSTIALWRSDHHRSGTVGEPDVAGAPVARIPTVDRNPPVDQAPAADQAPPEERTPASRPAERAAPADERSTAGALPRLPQDHEEFYRRPGG